MVDQDVKTVKDDHHSGALKHSHPSFGLISVCRISGNFDHQLFGCEVTNNHAIKIEIEKATVTQDLGRNWYHGCETVVQAVMSPVQYAEMISSPNTSGVPCTIQETSKDGRIKYKPIDTVTEYCESKIESKLNDAEGKIIRASYKIDEILNRKGALKKSDKEDLSNLVRAMKSDLLSSLPFYAEQFEKAIEKTKVEAKAEIESYVTHAITKAGIETINNPEALKLLIASKKD